MISGFLRELKEQWLVLAQVVRTREFWIYLGVILLFLLIAAAGVRLAAGFDPLTRGQLGMAFSCRTGEGQLATIIIGSLIFGLACVFTLGEVVQWVETTRASRSPGRHHLKANPWRPALHILGTIVLGAGGYLLMRTWCT